MEKAITGTMVYYYFVCKRKLWYFYHQIAMEQNHEQVKIGKIIDETTYRTADKHINIDDVINIDFIRKGRVLHEVKKSKKIEEASIWQVKYYLYYLEQKGVEGLVGQIDYPLLKQRVDISLEDKDREKIEQILAEIRVIVSTETATGREKEKNKICKSCAYFDLCYI